MEPLPRKGKAGCYRRYLPIGRCAICWIPLQSAQSKFRDRLCPWRIDRYLKSQTIWSMEVDMTDPTMPESEEPRKVRSRKGTHEPDEQLAPTTPANNETFFGDRNQVPPTIPVSLRRSESTPTDDQALWVA